jgi:AAA domain
MTEQWTPLVEAEKLAKLYSDDPRQNTFNLLLLGDYGTGKTRILETARRPVHVDSFDKGGTKTIQHLIKSGDCIADTRWENEDPLNPTVFVEWKREFEIRVTRGYFKDIGTYALDSSSAWAESIMRWVMKADPKGSRVGEAPKWERDYVPQKVQINNFLDKILTLPCDVVVTGHLKPEYDQITVDGEVVPVLVRYVYQTTGQGAIIIPTKFDEIYVASREAKGGKVEYKLLTSKDRYYSAKTRLGRDKFNQYENPSIKELLKKIGWDIADKPKLSEKYKKGPENGTEEKT